MGKRGRPRHPDILTPREWEVLAFIRDGFTNEEIAGRLAISVDGVKYHVSQILSKLAVSSREEAARWRVEERPWWLAAGVPLAWLWRRTASIASRLSPLSSALAVGLLTGAIAGLAALGFLVWRTGGHSHSEQAGPPAVFPTPVNGWPGMMHSFFVDSSHGWVPLRNVLFQTRDGGHTWTREYEATDDIDSVFFLSPQTGWLLSGSELSGTELWVSKDGGRTWKDARRTAPGAVRFLDLVNGWATSQLEDQIWKTSDEGASWQIVQGPCPELARSENGPTLGGGAPKVKVVSRPVSFIDPDNGWALCAESSQSGDDNKLFQTTDAGNHWKRLAVLPWDSISLQFIDKRHGWLLNFAGLNATDDGGRSWHQLAAFQPTGHIAPIFSDAQFVSQNQGFLNYAVDLAGPSAVFGTQDGGRTWTQLYAGPPPLSAPDVRVCEVADIEAKSWRGQPGGGQSYGGISLRNKSATACRVRGVPEVELLDSKANAISFPISSMCDQHTRSFLCEHPLEDVVLASGTPEIVEHTKLPAGRGQISFSWSTYGPEGMPCQTPLGIVSAIRLSWPTSNGSLTVPNNGIQPCRRISVSWFQPSVGVP